MLDIAAIAERATLAAGGIYTGYLMIKARLKNPTVQTLSIGGSSESIQAGMRLVQLEKYHGENQDRFKEIERMQQTHTVILLDIQGTVTKLLLPLRHTNPE